MARSTPRPADFAADLATRLGRPRRRPRWPLALALIAAGGAAWAASRNEMLRVAVTGRARALGDRMLIASSAWRRRESSEPVAFTAADTMPIAPPAFADAGISDSTDYPPGLGAAGDALGELESATARP
jgi:hypothetical protein